MNIVYSDKYNVDTLFYSATLLYNYDEVSTIIFSYVKVRFKLWDYFVKFIDSNNLIIRFSVYNPIFMMPS